MKTCKNCIWYGSCPDAGRRCEYYDPLNGDYNENRRLYEEDLREREREYRKVIEEFLDPEPDFSRRR